MGKSGELLGVVLMKDIITEDFKMELVWLCSSKWQKLYRHRKFILLLSNIGAFC